MSGSPDLVEAIAWMHRKLEQQERLVAYFESYDDGSMFTKEMREETHALRTTLDAIDGGHWEERLAPTPMNVVHAATLGIPPERERRWVGPWKPAQTPTEENR